MRIRRVVLVLLMVMGGQVGFLRGSHALSVGDITVQSRRGETFRAVAPLMLEPRERRQGVGVSIASAEEYRAEGLQRAAAISSLKTTITQGHPDTIRIVSEAPLQAPAFDLLLLVQVGHLTIVRNYHIVLPPPISPVPVVPVAAAQPAPPVRRESPAAPTPAVQRPVIRLSAALSRPARSSALPAQYGPIRPGATLYGVVRQVGVPREWTWQAVVFLWRANHAKFLRGNMHGLRVGTTLTIPPDLSRQLDSISRSQAQRLVNEQWQAWRTRRVITAAEAEAFPVMAVAAAPFQQPPDTQPVVDKPMDVKPAPATMFLPTDESSSLVSVAELQVLLQGLEERITRHLTPVQTTGRSTTVAFVNSSELQTTLHSLEKRLTERVDLMLAQGGTPVPVVAPRPVVQPPAGPEQVRWQPRTFDAAPRTRLSASWYILFVLNIVLLLVLGAMGWFWWSALSPEDRLAWRLPWRSRSTARHESVVEPRLPGKE